MVDTGDETIAEMAAPQPSALARHVARMLIDQLPVGQASGARIVDLVDGYRLAADRVAAWGDHQNWPQLRDGPA